MPFEKFKKIYHDFCNINRLPIEPVRQSALKEKHGISSIWKDEKDIFRDYKKKKALQDLEKDEQIADS